MARNRRCVRLRASLGSMLIALSILGAGAPPATAAGPDDEALSSAPVSPAPETGAMQPLGAPASLIPQVTPAAAQPACSSSTTDLKILVLAGNGKEPAMAAIRRALDGLGTPYTVWVAADRPGQLTAARLSSGCHAFYQAALLTNATLGYSNNGTWVNNPLSAAEWQTLYAYEASFGIRQVNWYASPSPATGFNWSSGSVDTAKTPLTTSLTAQGRTVFPYVHQGASIPIQGAFTYLATPLTDGATTPLLTDAHADALAAIRAYPDGRQALTLTFGTNPTLIQDLVLWYGLVNWATRGVFVGQRHAYLPVMVDDLFSPGAYFTPDRPCDQPTVSGVSYRTTGSDLTAFTTWARATRSGALTQNFVLSFAFIGAGTQQVPDALTTVAQQNARYFNWVNHTYRHLNMDSMDYATASSEISRNDTVSSQLGLKPFSASDLVTPALTGLANPAVLQAAFDTGVRQVIINPTQSSWTDPLPNTGVAIKGTYNTSGYALFGIPRRRLNLYSEVSTPEQWVARDHCVNPPGSFTYAATLDDVLTRESSTMLRYLLLGDTNPLGFHALNIRAYDGTHSLLSDLVDRTLQRYNQLVSMPILSPSMGSIGHLELDRRAFNRALPQLVASVATSATGRVLHITSPAAAIVPVTGLAGAGAEVYAGQPISHLSMQAGQSLSLALP
jgi:hypothetical protein